MDSTGTINLLRYKNHIKYYVKHSYVGINMVNDFRTSRKAGFSYKSRSIVYSNIKRFKNILMQEPITIKKCNLYKDYFLL